MALDVAVLIASLEAAQDAAALETACAAAKNQGFSNRHDAFKDAKRRLFALKNGVTTEVLPAKSQRKRPPAELPKVSGAAPDNLAPPAKKSKKLKQRESGGKTTKAEPLGGKNGSKPGDWTCPSCGHNVFASKSECFKCGAKKGDSGADPEASNDSSPAEGAAVPQLENQVRAQGFSPALKEDGLREFFGECGKIVDVTLVKTKEGRSRRIGFIAFKKEKGVEAALELHDTDCFNFKIKVTKAASADDAAKGHRGKDKIKELTSLKGKVRVFVGGLPYTTTEKQLRKLLKKSGELESLFMPINKRDGKCKGYAMATFATREGTDSALELNGTEFGGSKLVVELKKKGGKDAEEGVGEPSEFQVFAGGLFGIAKKKIKQLFADCGELASFDMPLSTAGESKGIAFVCFTSEEGLNKALELHDTEHGKRRLTVERRRVKDKGSTADPSEKLIGEKPVAKEPTVLPASWGKAAKVQFDDSDDE